METLSPPSDADAPNQVKVANVLPPGQKCTYTVMTGCESRASVPKIHSGNSSQKCTYRVMTGCESRDSVPKMHMNSTYMVISGRESRASVPNLHPNLIEASEGDDIVVSWQGGGRHLTNLENREANKQDRKPKKRSVRQAEDIIGKSKQITLNTVEIP